MELHRQRREGEHADGDRRRPAGQPDSATEHPEQDRAHQLQDEHELPTGEDRIGGAVELRFRHADLSPAVEETPERFKRYEAHVLRGRITLCEPPRRLAFTWGDDPAEGSEVTFELSARGEKVHLLLTHRRLADKGAMLSVSGGWHTHLAILNDNLEGRTPRPFWATHTEVDAEYRRRMEMP